MSDYKPFSIRERSRSFTHAFNGIFIFFRQEHNAVLHLLATVLVVALIILFPVSRIEIIVLIIVTGSVWVAEFFNTAIERIMDLITKEYHPEIKFIKDVTAAAVLITAIVAFVTACLVFVPKISI